MSTAVRTFLTLTILSLAEAAFAQSLVPPGEILIHVNGDVRNTDFVDPLVCALSKVLQAPVWAKPIDIALTADLLQTASQFSPRKIATQVVNATAGSSDYATPFRYFLLDHDLKSEPFNYVFAETYHAPWNLGVLSVARLVPDGAKLSRKQITETTQFRVYKLMLKSVARLSGLQGDGCVLAFPRSLEELDRKSPEFCPDDKAALVAARVIKDKPSESCSTVVAAQ